MGGRRSWILVCVAAGLVSTACSDDALIITPRSFERPRALTYTCFDQVARAMVPVRDCNLADPRFSLTGLVTQTARGEIASVDLSSETLVDSDVRIPGFTFVPTDEIPADIVVPPSSTQAYVASFGSSSIQSIPTYLFRPEAPAPPGAPQDPRLTLQLPERPVGLAVSPDERFIYAALPGAGTVVEIALAEGGAFGMVRELPLSADVPPPVDLRTLAPEVVPAPDEYQKICPPGLSVPVPPKLIAPREIPDTTGLAAAPVHLVVDPGTNRLYVADRVLPKVHVFDLGEGGATEAAPIVTAVPTRWLAVSPEVPATLADRSTTTRFLYAIDDTDGSVLVVDLRVNAVMPVSIAEGAPDRLDLGAPAEVMAIATPGYTGIDTPLCNEPNSGRDLSNNDAPRDLAGVFLAVGLLDGTLHYIDVYDLDAPCRGTPDCGGLGANPEDVQVFIRRHRPRIAGYLSAEGGLRLDNAPTFRVEGVVIEVEDSGVIGEGLTGPRLAPFDVCPEGMLPLFPAATSGGAPLICTLSDPWLARAEQWSATWGGTLPATLGGRGRFGSSECGPLTIGAGETCFLASDAAFCSQGTLGMEDVPTGEEPEAGYGGDRLVLVGDPPDEVGEGCERFLDLNGEPIAIGFPILRASAQALVLGQPTTTLADGSVPTADDVRRCFVELARYEVRAGQAYVVFGSQTGFLHRVVPDENGLCRVDASQPPTDIGRALSGRPYRNPFIAFQIEHPTRDAETTFAPTPDDDVSLTFTITDAPIELVTDVSDRPVVPVDLDYSPLTRRLYMVDQASRGLVQMDLSPVNARDAVLSYE